MRILYIYRHPDMGFSIGKVFKPIEKEMKKYAEVDSVCLPVANYKPKGLWNNIKAARDAAKGKKYDVIHITGAEHYLVPFLRGQKVVVTVHDLGFFTNHKWTLRAWWKYFAWIQTLRFADVVTFISEKSMNEAKSLVSLEDKRIRVVYNAVSPDFEFWPKQPDLENPFILHIGTKVNKNLGNTILAIKKLKCRLRIVGKLSSADRLLLSLYGVDYTVAENLTDSQIVDEYRKCDIVNFPSFYEGFGMPIIEGQATGRPVLTSNLSPMKEVAGEGAVLVDPLDVVSIHCGYIKILRNWNVYVEKGKNNVLRFALPKIVEDYYHIYKELADFQ